MAVMAALGHLQRGAGCSVDLSIWKGWSGRELKRVWLARLGFFSAFVAEPPVRSAVILHLLVADLGVQC